MSYDAVAVFFSSPMNTQEARAMRERVRDLFDSDDRLSLFRLYAMEAVASAAEPPPTSGFIHEDGWFLLVLPTSAAALRFQHIRDEVDHVGVVAVVLGQLDRA